MFGLQIFLVTSYAKFKNRPVKDFSHLEIEKKEKEREVQ